MKLSIIVPVKNDADGLEECLTSIRKAAIDSVQFEVIVVDNGSTDSSVSVAKRHGAKVLIDPDATVARLRNVGAHEACGGVLAFMDSDCTVSQTWFSGIGTYLDATGIVCFGSPPGIPASANWVQRCWYQIRRKDTQVAFDIEWLESMNLFVRKDAFEEIGGFDEKMTTCEDYDLCKRLAGSGSVVCDNRIAAIHHGEADSISRFYQKERWRGGSNLYGLYKHGFDVAELPSVGLPFVQILAIAVALSTLLLSAVVDLPIHIWLLGVVVWQAPLLMLGAKKAENQFSLKQVFGIYVLLNVYFLARGISLFSTAVWVEPDQVGQKVHLVL